MMIDLLCGPLNGNPYGPTISGMFTEMDTPRRLGAFFLMLDPSRFAGGENAWPTPSTKPSPGHSATNRDPP